MAPITEILEESVRIHHYQYAYGVIPVGETHILADWKGRIPDGYRENMKVTITSKEDHGDHFVLNVDCDLQGTKESHRITVGETREVE